MAATSNGRDRSIFSRPDVKGKMVGLIRRANNGLIDSRILCNPVINSFQVFKDYLNMITDALVNQGTIYPDNAALNHQ